MTDQRDHDDESIIDAVRWLLVAIVALFQRPEDQMRLPYD